MSQGQGNLRPYMGAESDKEEELEAKRAQLWEAITGGQSVSGIWSGEHVMIG